MKYTSKKSLGNWGEQIAEQAYLKRGFVLVARNIYNTRGKMLGEIDLVVRSHRSLVFVEVKTRKSSRFGSASESVTKAKQQKLVRAAHWFIRRFPQFSHLNPRIDVCAIDVAPGFNTPAHLSNLDKSSINVIIIPYAVTLDY